MFRTGFPAARTTRSNGASGPALPGNTGETTAAGKAGETPMTPRVTVSTGFDSFSAAGTTGMVSFWPPRSTENSMRSPARGPTACRRSEK
jgi:hypothetical protein